MKNTQRIMARIESHFDSMTELEKRIANYFLNPSSIYDDLSSQKVAQTLYISQAALTRFAKKCGFKGYREFNFQYIHQLQGSIEQTEHLQNDLSRRVLRNYTQIQQQTEELIDEDKLLRVANLIEVADRVYFFGTGSSGLVARDMKLRFMRLGVICEALTDQDGFAWTMGAKTVLVTGHSNKVKETFTEIITVATQNKPEYILRISAQFPMLLMIDLLYAFFLEIDRERKEKIFNSFWENQKLNGYYRRHK